MKKLKTILILSILFLMSIASVNTASAATNLHMDWAWTKNVFSSDIDIRVTIESNCGSFSDSTPTVNFPAYYNGDPDIHYYTNVLSCESIDVTVDFWWWGSHYDRSFTVNGDDTTYIYIIPSYTHVKLVFDFSSSGTIIM